MTHFSSWCPQGVGQEGSKESSNRVSALVVELATYAGLSRRGLVLSLALMRASMAGLPLTTSQAIWQPAQPQLSQVQCVASSYMPLSGSYLHKTTRTVIVVPAVAYCCYHCEHSSRLH